MSSPLSISHAYKFYEDLCAVNNVSFSIKPGEIFGLLGPNGAGKTSLIHMITTLEKIDSGKIEVFSFNVEEKERQAKLSMGVVPQEMVSHGFFTIEEILQFQSGYYGLWNNQKQICYLLKKLSLWKMRHKRVRQLSGGMKRRLLIAKALVHKPKLILLDEPTAGVDLELRKNLWDFVKELNGEGTTVLLTTHYLEEAEELCDRIAIINKGEIKMLDATKNILKKLTMRKVLINLKHSISLKENRYLLSQDENVLVFEIPQEMSLADLVEKTHLPFDAILDVRIREGKLEDAFSKIVGESHESRSDLDPLFELT